MVCPKALAAALFDLQVSQDKPTAPGRSHQVSLSAEDYVVVSIGGGGSEAGQRVLELTGPLALAGM